MLCKSYLLPMTLLGGLLLNALPSQGADTHAKDKQQIINNYKKIDAAFVAKDVNAAVALLTPDYTDINQDGKVQEHSKNEARANWVRISAFEKHAATKTVVDDITFAPDGATATITEDGSFQLIKSGHLHTFTFHTTERDFWVKHGNNWLQKRTRTLTNEATVDGQPMPSQGL